MRGYIYSHLNAISSHWETIIIVNTIGAIYSLEQILFIPITIYTGIYCFTQDYGLSRMCRNIQVLPTRTINDIKNRKQ